MTPNQADPHLTLTHIKYLIRSEGHDVDLEVGTLSVSSGTKLLISCKTQSNRLIQLHSTDPSARGGDCLLFWFWSHQCELGRKMINLIALSKFLSGISVSLLFIYMGGK